MRHPPVLLLPPLAVLLWTCAFAACGEPWPDDGASGDPGVPPSADPLPPADDVPVGEEVGDADPPPPCVDGCDDPADVADDGVDDVDGSITDDADTDGAPAHAAPGPDAKMVVRRYAAFRSGPDAHARVIDVAPHGGVHPDGLHPQRSPDGLLSPGQRVTLVDAEAEGGFLKVRAQGRVGFVHQSKLAWRDPALTAIQQALKPRVRNAFFKHQILRPRWNKDGPLTSANCGPTSLAMAVSVFGLEPAGLSVEQSIHHVRSRYDHGLHEREGTLRSEIQTAAQALGLRTHALASDVSPTAALRRLNGQLATGRAVVLNGQPGSESAEPTRYQRAFNRAYRAAIRNGAVLRHNTYTFDGHHSIFVLGRDAEGRYVVGDPLSEVGFVTLTRAEIKDFMRRFTGNRGTGTAVWR